MIRHAVIIAALALASPTALAAEWRVIDGDSLAFGAQRHRLHGIDAPELAQTCGGESNAWPCGQAAKQRLEELLQNRRLECESLELDRFGRHISQCRAYAADGRSIDPAAILVREGLAVAYLRYSSRYKNEERQARNARRGMWASKMMLPESFRHHE